MSANFYNTGTASVNNGSTAVTGVGTAWLSFLEVDDIFTNPLTGIEGRIASVNTDTSLTLAFAWPGATMTNAAYEVRIWPASAELALSVRTILSTLSNGQLGSIAALTPTLGDLLQYNNVNFWENVSPASLGTSILCNGFIAFTGPTTLPKTFTLPDASSTILTSHAAVTVAQGGTGLATLTVHALQVGNGTGSPTQLAVGTSGQFLAGVSSVTVRFSGDRNRFVLNAGVV
jgi:hypothetical protein